MITIPLTQIESPETFSAEVENHLTALKKHQMGKPGHPVPIASPLVDLVITRKPQDGPVATRGPDDFVIAPYQIIDDRPVSPEVQALRESILK